MRTSRARHVCLSSRQLTVVRQNTSQTEWIGVQLEADIAKGCAWSTSEEGLAEGTAALSSYTYLGEQVQRVHVGTLRRENFMKQVLTFRRVFACSRRYLRPTARLQWPQRPATTGSTRKADGLRKLECATADTSRNRPHCLVLLPERVLLSALWCFIKRRP